MSTTAYDMSRYYVDFSNRDNLTEAEKIALENIQKIYKPLERIELLIDYRVNDKITADDYETMTGLPYNFGS
jgi:hypothetical protein